METAEKIHPLQWARENLSEARARAFWRAYLQLERNKCSDEYHAEYKKSDEIRYAFARANLAKTDEIQNKAEQEARELEQQAHELMKRARDIRTTAREEADRIQSAVYDTEEYKTQREKVSKLWRRDDEAFQPKAQALMDKYLKAQERNI